MRVEKKPPAFQSHLPKQPGFIQRQVNSDNEMEVFNYLKEGSFPLDNEQDGSKAQIPYYYPSEGCYLRAKYMVLSLK